MSSIISIRRATRSDARGIALLSRDEIEHDLPWQWTPRKLRRCLKQPNTNAYVAYRGNTLISFSIARLDNVEAHLVLLAVHPEWRRAGIGTQLLNWQLIAAQTAGFESMSLELRTRNANARKFYETAGFVCKRRVAGYYNKQEDALRLVLKPIQLLDSQIT